MQIFNSIDGQSVLDVCLNTYGSLDYVGKMMSDNGVELSTDMAGRAARFDDTLIADQVITKTAKAATLFSPLPSSDNTQSLSIISRKYSTGADLTPQSTDNMKIENDYYVAGTDGVTTATLSGRIGWDVKLVIKEVKPLLPSEFTWNKTTGALALLGGLSLMTNETLFFLFTKSN